MPGVADDEGAERLAVGDEAEPGVQAPELRQEGRRIGAPRDAGEDEHRALDRRRIPSDPGAGRLEGGRGRADAGRHRGQVHVPDVGVARDHLEEARALRRHGDLDPAAGGSGQELRSGEVHVAAGPRHRLSAPEGAGGVEGLVEPADALGRGEHGEAEALVDRPVADRDQESQAPRRDPLRAGDDLREMRRVPVVDEAERADRDPPRAGDQRGGDRPAVERLPAGVERRVAVDEGRVVAELLGELDEGEQLLEAVDVCAEVDAEPQPMRPTYRAAWRSASALFASLSSRRQTSASASSRLMRTGSITSSASYRWATGSRSKPAKRKIRSSVKPGVVQIQPSSTRRPARQPASSSSSRTAQRAGDSPGSSFPAGTSRIVPPAAWRYWRIRSTSLAETKGTTAAAPGWCTMSSSTELPFGRVTRSVATRTRKRGCFSFAPEAMAGSLARGRGRAEALCEAHPASEGERSRSGKREARAARRRRAESLEPEEWRE